MTTESAEPKCPGCGDTLYPGEICDYCNEAALYWSEDDESENKETR